MSIWLKLVKMSLLILTFAGTGATPRPVCLFMAYALATQVVIVSGTTADISAIPRPLKYKQINIIRDDTRTKL